MTKVWEVKVSFSEPSKFFNTYQKAAEYVGNKIQSTYEWGWIKNTIIKDCFNSGLDSILIIEREVL